MATLTVDGTNNYSLTVLPSIDTIKFVTTTGDPQTATFLGSQFDGSPILTNVLLSGSGISLVVINSASVYNASAWRFSFWDTSDEITVNGTKFADSFIGALSQGETIFGGAGADRFSNIANDDRLNGGFGDDIFTIKPNPFGFGGTTIDGGSGVDSLVADDADGLAISFTIQNVERLQFGRDTATLDVRGSHFNSTNGFSQIVGNGQINLLKVRDSGADLSLATFSNWTVGTDKIAFLGFGSDAPGAVVGSQLGDEFNFVGTGGTKHVFIQADGQGGDDTFVFSKQLAGFETVAFDLDGGAGSGDTLRLQNLNGTAVYDFRHAAIAGIERLELTGSSTTAVLSFNQMADVTNVAFGNSGAKLELYAIIGSATDLSALSATGGSFSKVIVHGTALDDTIGGTSFTDDLRGDLGNDSLNGAGGNDTMDGGLGNDTLIGGEGNDTLLGADGNDTLDGGTGADTADGGVGDDVIKGGEGADQNIGGVGNDTIDYGSSNDAVILDFIAGLFSGGHAQSDTLTDIEHVTGSSFGDSINGNGAHNTFKGGGGNDFLIGNLGRDTLNGDAGGDTLDGGSGFDKLTGGVGRDTLTGGGDSDFFYFTRLVDSAAGGAADTITDFTQGQDKINLVGIDADTGGGTANDAFTFIGGAAFSSIAGEVRFEVVTGAGGTRTVISLDATGDGIADSQIKLVGSYDLLGTDFAL